MSRGIFKPRVLHGKLLHLANRPGPDEVQEVADGAALMASVESPAMTGPVTA